MKIKFYTRWGNRKPQRVIECESADFVTNELHIVSGGWRTPLAQYVSGRWHTLADPTIPASEHMEICP